MRNLHNANTYSLLPVRRQLLWFVVPALFGIAALLVLVAYKQGLLTSKEKLYFTTSTAAGITMGLPVKLNGFTVGSVDGIKLLPPSIEPDKRVQIELGIYRDYMAYIPKTTRAKIGQEGLIGQSLIELRPQRYDARPVANGEMLEFETSKNFGEIAMELHSQIIPVLQNIQTLTTQLNDPKGSLQQALRSTNDVLVELQRTNKKLQSTLDQTGSSIRGVEQQANTTMRTADHLFMDVNKSLPSLLTKVDKAADDLQKASGDIQRITSYSSQRVPQILDTVQDAASNGQEIIHGAKKTWPISTMIGPPEPKLAPLDSQQGLPPPGRKP